MSTIHLITKQQNIPCSHHYNIGSPTLCLLILYCFRTMEWYPFHSIHRIYSIWLKICLILRHEWSFPNGELPTSIYYFIFSNSITKGYDMSMRFFTLLFSSNDMLNPKYKILCNYVFHSIVMLPLYCCCIIYSPNDRRCTHT